MFKQELSVLKKEKIECEEMKKVLNAEKKELKESLEEVEKKKDNLKIKFDGLVEENAQLNEKIKLLEVKSVVWCIKEYNWITY